MFGCLQSGIAMGVSELSQAVDLEPRRRLLVRGTSDIVSWSDFAGSVWYVWDRGRWSGERSHGRHLEVTGSLLARRMRITASRAREQV